MPTQAKVLSFRGLGFLTAWQEFAQPASDCIFKEFWRGLFNTVAQASRMCHPVVV